MPHRCESPPGPSNRPGPRAGLALALALCVVLAPGLPGCGPSSNRTERVLDDPPPPDPDEMSSDNMPDPRMIQSLHDEAPPIP